MPEATTETTATQYHFYVSNVEEYRCTTPTRSLSDVIKFFEASKLTYVIFFVPVPYNTSYPIQSYAPQVEGAHLVEEVTFRKGRRVRS